SPSCCVHLSSFTDSVCSAIYTLSLHDALPISELLRRVGEVDDHQCSGAEPHHSSPARGCAGDSDSSTRTPPALRGWTNCTQQPPDRKSTRLNSSHVKISYAVFCLKKKSDKTTR